MKVGVLQPLEHEGNLQQIVTDTHGKVSTLVGFFDQNKGGPNTVHSVEDDGLLDHGEARSLSMDEGLPVKHDSVVGLFGNEAGSKQMQHLISIYMKPNSCSNFLQSFLEAESYVSLNLKQTPSYNLTFRKSHPSHSLSPKPRFSPYKIRPIPTSIQAKRSFSREDTLALPQTHKSILHISFPNTSQSSPTADSPQPVQTLQENDVNTETRDTLMVESSLVSHGNELPTAPLPTPTSVSKDVANYHTTLGAWARELDEERVKGGSKEQTQTIPVKKTMAEVLRGNPSTAGPKILDTAQIKQRGTVSTEEGIPCLHIPDADNLELSGCMGLALIGKFSHSIPAPNLIRKALANFKLRGTLK